MVGDPERGAVEIRTSRPADINDKITAGEAGSDAAVARDLDTDAIPRAGKGLDGVGGGRAVAILVGDRRQI